LLSFPPFALPPVVIFSSSHAVILLVSSSASPSVCFSDRLFARSCHLHRCTPRPSALHIEVLFPGSDFLDRIVLRVRRTVTRLLWHLESPSLPECASFFTLLFFLRFLRFPSSFFQVYFVLREIIFFLILLPFFSLKIHIARRGVTLLPRPFCAFLISEALSDSFFLAGEEYRFTSTSRSSPRRRFFYGSSPFVPLPVLAVS